MLHLHQALPPSSEAFAVADVLLPAKKGSKGERSMPERHQEWKVPPSCVPKGFLLELLPSEVFTGHIAAVILDNKPLVQQHLSMAETSKVCSLENSTLDTHPCTLQTLLSTCLTHYFSCCALLPYLQLYASSSSSLSAEDALASSSSSSSQPWGTVSPI